MRRDDRAVSDLHSRHHDAVPAEPYVVADHGVALVRKLRKVYRRDLRPCLAHYVERVGGRAAKPVVRRAHNELRSARDLAEFSDDEFVAEYGVVEQNVVLFEARRVFIVVVIGIVADADVGRFDDVFDETTRPVLVGEYGVRVGEFACVFQKTASFSSTMHGIIR